jgi:hypothetical protein
MSHTENDSHDLLRRILGEEEAGDILTQVQARQSDQQLLAAAGIDAEAMLTRATAQITLAEQLAEHGVTPPRTIEHLTDDEFQALSNEDLEHYLAGYGIDIDALLARTEQLIEDQAPQPAANWLTKLGGFLPRWPTGPALGAAVSAVLALGVGITVLRMLPPEKPPVATASVPAKPEAVTLARSATVNGKPAAPGADLDSAPAAASSEVASLLTDKSTAVQLASATAESIRKDESLKRQEMAMESKAVMEQETVMRAAEEKKKMADASNPPETLLSATASSAAPARTNFDFYTVLPEMETVAAREKVTASVETAAPSPAAALKVDLKNHLMMQPGRLLRPRQSQRHRLHKLPSLFLALATPSRTAWQVPAYRQNSGRHSPSAWAMIFAPEIKQFFILKRSVRAVGDHPPKERTHHRYRRS